MHLTNESLGRLLAGTADPAEARALALHLERDCPECEALLASKDAAPLDALADRALTALAPPRPEEQGNDLEYARIQRKVRPRRSAVSRWAPLAAAAAVLLVVGVGVERLSQRSGRPEWDGMKGVTSKAARPVPVRVSMVAVLPQADGEPKVWKVANGDSLPRGAALQLRVEVGGPADVVLARAGAGGDVEAFWREHVGSAGSVQVTVDGRPAAYPLSGLTGPQRFVALASHTRLSPEQVSAAARALAPPGRLTADAPSLEGLSLDVVEISVR